MDNTVKTDLKGDGKMSSITFPVIWKAVEVVFHSASFGKEQRGVELMMRNLAGDTGCHLR